MSTIGTSSSRWRTARRNSIPLTPGIEMSLTMTEYSPDPSDSIASRPSDAVSTRHPARRSARA